MSGHGLHDETSRARCDLCGAPRPRHERNRIVWEAAPGDDLVLAELCGRCASKAVGILDVHGGRGRDALRLVQEAPAAMAEPTRIRAGAGGLLVRSLVYLLIALTAFMLVTLVTSRS